jgi:hypothetical protein
MPNLMAMSANVELPRVESLGTSKLAMKYNVK